MKNKEDKDMFAETALRKTSLKKPRLTKNKFANMTKKDWQETNEQSKKDRGLSGITFKDLFRG